MKTVRIIPCLDVDHGRVVKGVNFVGLRDAGDPVELAARYDREGADELIFLDITASAESRETMIEVVEKVAEEVFIPFTVGGGVRSIEDARLILRAGADKVSLNSAAVENPELIDRLALEFGSQCVVVAIDARRSLEVESGFEVFTHGGRRGTGLDAVSWAAIAEDLGADFTFAPSEHLKDSILDVTKEKGGVDLVIESVGQPSLGPGHPPRPRAPCRPCRRAARQ